MFLIATSSVAGSPVEFGATELNRALAERRLPPLRIPVEVRAGAPESWSIGPDGITGGDERGLMYGLLEAAADVRAFGHVTRRSGRPATPLRGIRSFIHNRDLERDWYYSREYWDAYVAMLARNRFNRFNLVFGHHTNYLTPPYPFWVRIPEFPAIRVEELTDAQRERNLEMLRYISQTAADYGIDFTLGIWEHNVRPPETPTVDGLTRDNIGPYSAAALAQVLRHCPGIRAAPALGEYSPARSSVACSGNGNSSATGSLTCCGDD